MVGERRREDKKVEERSGKSRYDKWVTDAVRCTGASPVWRSSVPGPLVPSAASQPARERPSAWATDRCFCSSAGRAGRTLDLQSQILDLDSQTLDFDSLPLG